MQRRSVRVLVVADDAEVRATRARDLELGGHEVCGTSDGAHLAARVRAGRPEALLVVAPGSTSELRMLLSRARDAAEAALPALLLFPNDSLWLHAALPNDLAPAVALATSATDASSIGEALTALLAGAPRTRSVRIGEVVFDGARRQLIGPAAGVSLTPSESAVLSLLVARPGEFVAMSVLARALWGDPLTDRHAQGAIRSHVHTLRGKLREAGFAGSVESRLGAGYRLVLDGSSAS